MVRAVPQGVDLVGGQLFAVPIHPAFRRMHEIPAILENIGTATMERIGQRRDYLDISEVTVQPYEFAHLVAGHSDPAGELSLSEPR